MNIFREFIFHKAHIHLIATYIITLLGSIYSVPIGVLIAATLSVAKEIYDEKHGGEFSMIDILGDTIGILLGIVTVLFISGGL